MAKIGELTDAELAEAKEWFDTRPPEIQAMIRSHPPDRLYRNLGYPGVQRVAIIAYAGDGTVRVFVSGKYNAVAFEREVFGVRLADLVECDLPPADEPVGVPFASQADIDGCVGLMAVGDLAIPVEHSNSIQDRIGDFALPVERSDSDQNG